MLGSKLSIEVGGDQRYVIVKSNGGAVNLKGAGQDPDGFENESDAHAAARLLGPGQVGAEYTVEPLTIVNSRKASPGRKPGTRNGQAESAAVTPSAPASAPQATQAPKTPAGTKS